MAWRGIALAFALVLLSASVCTCVSVTYSKKKGALPFKDRSIVYNTLRAMVGYGVIDKDTEYMAGYLFTKKITVTEKEAVIRLTRWSSNCSVSMSLDDASQGSDLLEALNRMVPTVYRYLSAGYMWVSVSHNRDWIDYFVTQDVDPSYNSRSVEGDCTIQPSMLLSHPSALPFVQLLPGNTLNSPDTSYRFTIPSGAQDARCVLNLEDAHGNITWSSLKYIYPPPQDNCYLAFGGDGDLVLWNKNCRIWSTGSACSSGTDCAGIASLAFSDGRVKLYKTLDDDLVVYWNTT